MHTRTRSSFSVPLPFAFSFLFPSSNNQPGSGARGTKQAHAPDVHNIPVSIFLHIILSIYTINQAQKGRPFSDDAEACDHCIGSVASICVCSQTDPVKAHKASAASSSHRIFYILVLFLKVSHK